MKGHSTQRYVSLLLLSVFFIGYAVITHMIRSPSLPNDLKNAASESMSARDISYLPTAAAAGAAASMLFALTPSFVINERYEGMRKFECLLQSPGEP